MTLIVKICGITKPDQGRAIAEAGATMLGFICAPTSPRYVTPAQIAQVVEALPTDEKTGQIVCDRVGVFVNTTIDVIRDTVAIGHLNVVQLHGNETPEFCEQLGQELPTIKLIKALRVQSSAEVFRQAMCFQKTVEMLLLDAYHPSLAGGTGKTLDWQNLRAFQPTTPWLLAGGLTPDNILDALHEINPSGIDLSSGVEVSPGIKDLVKVSNLFAALQKTTPR